MNELSGIHGLPIALPPAGAAPSTDPKTMRIEFDALILQMLIKSSGLLDALDSGEGAAPGMGDMLAYPLARQLAEQVDLGFGSMVVRMSDTKAVQGE